MYVLLGSSTFRKQSFSRFQSINMNYTMPNLPNEIVSIRQALTSNDSNSIGCFIIQIIPSVTYESQGFSRTSTFILIGDQSGTAYLTATNLKEGELKPDQSYTMTNIRKNFQWITNSLNDHRHTFRNFHHGRSTYLFDFSHDCALTPFRSYLRISMTLMKH